MTPLWGLVGAISGPEVPHGDGWPLAGSQVPSGPAICACVQAVPAAEVSQDEGRAAGVTPRWTSLLTPPWVPLLPWRPPGHRRLSSQIRSWQMLSVEGQVVNIPDPVGQMVPSPALDSALIWRKWSG